MPTPDDTWQQALTRAIHDRDLFAVRRIPKTDLHCHGLLTAPLDTFAQLLGCRLPPVPQRFADFSDFAGYIAANLVPALHSVEAIRTLVRAAFERTADDGVVYAEISFDLFLPDWVPGLSAEGFADLLREECGRVADRLLVAPELGISRALPPDEILPRLRRALRTGVWRSVDLYDDERLGSIRDFVPLYRLAAEHGLKRKAHAGELCGADLVRESIAAFGLDAVQHGVRAVEDPALVDLLASRGIALHICPTSNFALGVCPPLDPHPIRSLFDSGIRTTVNSDDFALFGASVSDELLRLAAAGFSPEEIVRLVANGLAEMPGAAPTP